MGNGEVREGRGGLRDSEEGRGGRLMSGRWDSASSRMIHAEGSLKGAGGEEEGGGEGRGCATTVAAGARETGSKGDWERREDESCTERRSGRRLPPLIHPPARPGFPLFLQCHTSSSSPLSHFPAWENSCAAAAAILNYIGQWEPVRVPLFCDGFTVRALPLSSE